MVVGLITAHNIVLNCLIISSITITGLIEYSQVWLIISQCWHSWRREERGGDVGCQFNSQSICHLPGWTRLDISLSIPLHIPGPADYTILARKDWWGPAWCLGAAHSSGVLPPSYTSWRVSYLSHCWSSLTTIVVNPLYFLSNINNSFIKKSRLSKMDGKLLKTKAEPRSGY